MVIANPPLAEPVIDPGGVTIKPPFEMGVANLLTGTGYIVAEGSTNNIIYRIAANLPEDD